MAKKKPNKRQRDAKRAEHAAIWQKAFDFAYKMGYEQGQADTEREMLIGMRREVNKVMLRGS